MPTRVRAIPYPGQRMVIVGLRLRREPVVVDRILDAEGAERLSRHSAGARWVMAVLAAGARDAESPTSGLIKASEAPRSSSSWPHVKRWSRERRVNEICQRLHRDARAMLEAATLASTGNSGGPNR